MALPITPFVCADEVNEGSMTGFAQMRTAGIEYTT
jgi:hypothetical protein